MSSIVQYILELLLLFSLLLFHGLYIYHIKYSYLAHWSCDNCTHTGIHACMTNFIEAQAHPTASCIYPSLSLKCAYSLVFRVWCSTLLYVWIQPLSNSLIITLSQWKTLWSHYLLLILNNLWKCFRWIFQKQKFSK